MKDWIRFMSASIQVDFLVISQHENIRQLVANILRMSKLFL